MSEQDELFERLQQLQVKVTEQYTLAKNEAFPLSQRAGILEGKSATCAVCSSVCRPDLMVSIPTWSLTPPAPFGSIELLGVMEACKEELRARNYDVGVKTIEQWMERVRTSFHELKNEASIAEAFEIVKQLAKTNLGAVYLAMDRTIHPPNNKVVLKSSLYEKAHGAENPMLEASFLRLANLDGHPGMLRIRAFVAGVKGYYLVTDYVDGGDLFGRVSSQPLKLSEARAFFRDLCEAIQYLHCFRGVAHLDLKPENILITKGGKLKVCDFGVSSILVPKETPANLSVNEGITYQFALERARKTAEFLDIEGGTPPELPFSKRQAYEEEEQEYIARTQRWHEYDAARTGDPSDALAAANFPPEEFGDERKRPTVEEDAEREYRQSIEMSAYVSYFTEMMGLDQLEMIPETRNVGTENYQAPEIWEGKGYDAQKADIYSLGVILFILVTGYPPYLNPFSRTPQYRTFAALGVRGLLKAYGLLHRYQEDLLDLLDHTLTRDVSKRFNITQVLNHPWLRRTRSAGIFEQAKVQAAEDFAAFFAETAPGDAAAVPQGALESLVGVQGQVQVPVSEPNGNIE